MTPGNAPDLTYGQFIIKRAVALARLHSAQAQEARVLDPRYTLLTDDAARLARAAVQDAEDALAQVLAAWARSKFNR